MNKWLEILDHGDDPGRYTIIRGDGRISGCNENGTIVFKRKCANPDHLVYSLRREPGVGIVPPKQAEALLKKFALIQSPLPND